MKIKIFLIGLISIVLLLALTGCGTEETVTNEEVGKQINSLIDDIFSDTEDDNTTTSGSKAKSTQSNTLGLYSDDTRLVFKDEDDDDTYFVFTYSGDEITGYSAYVIFDSEADAKTALAEYNEDPDEDVKKAYVNGNTVIIEYDESVYGDLTVSTVKYAYSLLTEVTE